MITLKELPEHLRNLSEQNWNKLFDLISQIEQTKTFGEVVVDQEVESGVKQFPYVNYSSLVHEFYKIVYDLKLVVVFNWMDWTEGKEIIDKQAYEGQNIITLCKLLTTIIRADRFSDGYLLSAFKHGDILAILKEMKKKNIS